MKAKGIDVSHHNGRIDWKRVKAAGIEFAIIRAGYGTGTVDECFLANIQDAADAGVKIGIFWFGYAATEAQAKSEAAFCIKTLEPYRQIITYPVFYDWEYQSAEYIEKRGHKTTKELVSGVTLAFMEAIKAAGYKTGYYANPDYLSRYYDDRVKGNYDLWLAHVGKDGAVLEKSNYSGKYTMHQYSWVGSIPGITGKVDTDYDYTYCESAEALVPAGSKYLIDCAQEQASKVTAYSLSMMGNAFLSPHFQVKEFRSPDSDTVLIDSRLIWLLERLFTELDCSKMIINSGYRTPVYSVKVGGTSTDKHTKGMAADIKPYDKNGKIISGKEVCKAAEKHGDVFGIGYISETSVHIDTRPRSEIWFGDETNGTSLIRSGYTSFEEYFSPRYTVSAVQSGFTKSKAEETAVYLRKLGMTVTVKEENA